jgi:hypothetical protein
MGSGARRNSDMVPSLSVPHAYGLPYPPPKLPCCIALAATPARQTPMPPYLLTQTHTLHSARSSAPPAPVSGTGGHPLHLVPRVPSHWTPPTGCPWTE